LILPKRLNPPRRVEPFRFFLVFPRGEVGFT